MRGKIGWATAAACAVIVAPLLAVAAAGQGSPLSAAAAAAPPPAGAGFDYQIGGDYPLPDGVSIVSRDWFIGSPAAAPVYSICYLNAFQTQADERGVKRPDEHSSWPRSLVLERLGDDPNWGGEYLIDIRTANKRRRAARRVERMIDGCARRGFDAVELDNLDSWTRFEGTPLNSRVPFGRKQALAYAKLIAELAAERGLAVAQKNTSDLSPKQVRRVGFDFAIAEECARYRECGSYRRLHGDNVIVIEYRRKDLRRACATVGGRLSVVLRDRQVSRPGSRRYVYDAC
jgi:hypothetical protein